MKFTAFNLHHEIIAAISTKGYEEPTPIQKKAIPPIISGRDLLGLAQTGTGKTAAFVLPIVHQLMKGRRRCIRALILAPTRELAAQTNETIHALSRRTGLRSMAIYGGVPMNPQIQAVKRGVEIIVACPGRLLDLISQRNIDLSGVEMFVIDEADRMFDMGFLPDIRRIAGHLPRKRQTLLFSATMPEDIRHLVDEMLTDAVTIEIDHTKPLETVCHALYPVKQHLKAALLKELLARTDAGSVLVFTRTKHRAERLARQLSHSGFRAASLQGDLTQNRRRQAIEGFRDGSYQILVATDIAARGIDVSEISHVINFDMPDTADAYTHRIGRTGRAAKTGEAFTFITHDDTNMVRTIERILGEKLVRKTLNGFDYSRPDDSPVQAARPRQPKPRPAYPQALSRGKPAGAPRRSEADRYRTLITSR